MDGKYQSLTWQSLESTVLFWGEYQCKPNYFFRGNNVRDNYVIHYIKKGKGTFSSAGRNTVSLEAGDVFILPKGVPCFYQADGEEPWEYFWIGISGTKVKTMLGGSLLGQQRYLRHINHSQFYTSLTNLLAALKAPSSLSNDILVESLTYQMFYHLVVEFPTPVQKKSSHSHEHLKLAVYYLQHNFKNSSCNIEQLSQHLNLSRSYLYSIFKQSLNLSPQKYLTQLRMEEAAAQLKTTNHPIMTIAHKVGYKDEFTFSKAFKRYSGFSPKYYRQNEH